jgi:hypothetical protein
MSSSIYDDNVESSSHNEVKEDHNDTDESSSMDTKEDGLPLVSKPSPNTVIMFDWDDTLLASSYLAGLGYRLDSADITNPEVDAAMRALEATVCTLLNLALQYGTVNIVTNAETGWVQLSAQKFMPLVVPMLSRVNVISARSTYEPHHPEQPLKWKYYAFHERLSSVFGSGVPLSGSWSSSGVEVTKNVVSFGDSHVEREAIRAVTRGVAGCRTKSVKFAERPTPEQLRRQLELVSNCFHYIHNHDADLDLQLTVTLNAPASPSSPSAAAPATGVSAPSPVMPSPPTALPTTEVA